MIGIPFGTVQWLADKILQRGKDRASDVKEKRDRVANYFLEIASTIEEMLVDFRNGKVPRISGNKLEILIRDFEQVVHSIYDPKIGSEKQKVFDALADLYRTADRAREEDFLMIGSGYFGAGNSKMREKFLEDLERIIGRYRGISASLRAIAV